MARKLIRKRFLLVLIMTLVLGAFFISTPMRARLGGWIFKKAIRMSLHQEVSWKSMDLELLPPQIHFTDILIPPFVSAQTLTVTPSFPRFLTSSIFISGLTVNLNALPSAAQTGKTPTFPFIYLDHLTVIKSRLRAGDAEIPLDADFDGLAIFTWGRKGLLWSQRSILKIMDYEPIECRARIAFHKGKNRLELDHVLLDGRDAVLSGKGNFSTNPLSFDLDYSLQADLAPWLKRFRVPVGAEGHGRLEGQAHFRSDGFTTRVRGNLTETKVLGSRAGDLLVDADVTIGAGGRRVNASLAGRYASARGVVEIGKHVETRVALSVHQAPVKKILNFFSVPEPAYDAPVDGGGTFAFTDDRIAEATGDVHLSGPGGALEFNGKIHGLAMTDVHLALRDEGLDLNAEGGFPFNTTDPVTVRGTALRSSLRALQKFLSPFLPSLDPVDGWAEGSFTMTRTFDRPFLSVDARMGDVRYADLPWGGGTAQLHMEGSTFILDSVKLALAQGTLEASGNPAEGFTFSYRAWPWALPISMALSGSGRMVVAPKFSVSGEVFSAAIPSLPLPVDSLKARFSYDGKLLMLDDLDVRSGAGSLTGSARYAASFQFSGEVEKFPIADGITAGGSFSGEVRGSESKAELRLTFEGGPEGIFPANVKASLNGGAVRVEASTFRNGSFTAEGTLSADYTLALTGRLRDLQVPVPSVRLEPPPEGSFSLRGNLKDAQSLSGTVEFPPFAIRYGGNEFHVPKGLKAQLSKGRLAFGATDVTHDYAIIEAEGEAQLAKNLPFTGHIVAYFGDVLVHHLVPELDYSGEATLDVRVSKPALVPALDGTLDVDGSLLKILPIGMVLERPQGRVHFSGNRVVLEEFSARTGEGRITAHGEAFTRPEGGTPTLNLHVDGEKVAVNYPRGLRMVLNGNADLMLTPAGRLLTAQVTLAEGAYTRELNLLSEIARAVHPSSDFSSIADLPDIRLGISIAIPGTLKVRNQMAEAVAQGELHIVGTLPRPVILGQLETLPGGKVYFNGVTYTVDRALAQLNNPQTLDPYLDLEAEATVKTYLIHLKLTGPLSRLQLSFTADPFLTEADILSLLATGKIASQEQGVYLSGATLLLSQQLSQQLSKNTSAIFGLDRVRIEPIVGTSSITSAKLTVTKQVSSACTLSYTYNPSINQKDIVAVECTVSRDAYLELQQEEDGSYSVEVFRRKKF